MRFENKLSYSRNTNIAAIAGLLAGNFSFTTGFEGFTLPQTTTAFSNALTSAGFMGDGAETDKPFAYINYILYDESMTMVDAGWQRVDESMGFDAGQEALTFHQHQRLAFEQPIYVPENGYIYVWVSNESEGTKVWFDDVRVTHTQIAVTQASDYGVWGDVLRELKSPELTYRHGYQGNFSEKDKETGWNHFELREYDVVIGRWLIPDPKRQYANPYLAFGNSPINKIDRDGGSDSDPDPPIPNAPIGGRSVVDIMSGQKWTSTPGGGWMKLDGCGDPLISVSKPEQSNLAQILILAWPESATTVGSGAALATVTLWGVGLLVSSVALKGDTGPSRITLYRGVHFGHPDYRNALLGTATPWGGHSDPELHNQGDNMSIFTSWSVSKDVARRFAGSHGVGGVVLTKSFKLEETVPSPNITRGEFELLVPGIVTGANVEIMGLNKGK